jgi:hypothetical protein
MEIKCKAKISNCRNHSKILPKNRRNRGIVDTQHTYYIFPGLVQTLSRIVCFLAVVLKLFGSPIF